MSLSLRAGLAREESAFRWKRQKADPSRPITPTSAKAALAGTPKNRALVMTIHENKFSVRAVFSVVKRFLTMIRICVSHLLYRIYFKSFGLKSLPAKSAQPNDSKEQERRGRGGGYQSVGERFLYA